MGTITLLDFVLYLSLFFFVLYITRINNMWGVSKGTKKAKEDVRLEKNRQKKRLRYLAHLTKFAWVAKNFGFDLTPYKEKTYKYQLARLRWNIQVLNRSVTPLELVGILKTLTILFIFIGVVGFLLTKSPLFIFSGVALLLPSIFSAYANGVISSEDAELEREFPDFFLVLYNRLIQGSNIRLAPTLKDYMFSLDVMHGGKCDNIIKNFVMDLRNNIEIYGDDGMAITKLRDKYNSVMIINFCNLAVQALNGVKNSDKLLSFKIELNSRRIEQMKKRADKLVARGSKAVYVIYVILFQFVLLSWVAKLSLTGGLGSILGW
jgi:hypothetical protein